MRFECVRKALLGLPKERERIQLLFRDGYITIKETKH
jgi:hypothetical protein